MLFLLFLVLFAFTSILLGSVAVGENESAPITTGKVKDTMRIASWIKPSETAPEALPKQKKGFCHTQTLLRHQESLLFFSLPSKLFVFIPINCLSCSSFYACPLYFSYTSNQSSNKKKTKKQNISRDLRNFSFFLFFF